MYASAHTGGSLQRHYGADGKTSLSGLADSAAVLAAGWAHGPICTAGAEIKHLPRPPPCPIAENIHEHYATAIANIQSASSRDWP